MTAKRDSKSKPRKAGRPKLKKETLKDLEAKGGAVKGGGVPIPTKGCTQRMCEGE